ncbi:copia protein [Tanacetum coccineum]
MKTVEASETEPSQGQQTKDPNELSDEELKNMIELVPVKEVYFEALQVKRPIIAWDVHSEGQIKLWKITRVGDYTKLYQTFEDMLKRYMHDPLEWKLYDTCGVHHVFTGRGQEIFMLVEKDYPLTKGLATVMLCNKLQVDQYSEMANTLMYKLATTEFPLPEELSTDDEDKNYSELFEFKSEEGLPNVIENGPWLVDQKPLFVQRWVSGICLEKLEPSRIPL